MVARKKPAARGAQQTPKKGTLRRTLSNEVKRGTPGKRPGYTPADQKDDPQPPRGREKLEITGGQLKALTPSKLYPKLCSMGHVPDLKDNKSLGCGEKSLGHKVTEGHPGGWRPQADRSR